MRTSRGLLVIGLLVSSLLSTESLCLAVGTLQSSLERANTVPQTAADHLAMSASYQKKAMNYREDAEFHRRMLADYKKGVAVTPKSHIENPWIKKMRVHCEEYIRTAERLAKDAEEFAKYHTFRGKELQGK